LAEQVRVDIEGTLPVRALLDHHRDQRTHPASGLHIKVAQRPMEAERQQLLALSSDSTIAVPPTTGTASRPTESPPSTVSERLAQPGRSGPGPLNDPHQVGSEGPKTAQQSQFETGAGRGH